jgi:hypothetical protein
MLCSNTTVPAQLATFTVEPMGRKHFNSFIYDLFGLQHPQNNDVKADVEIEADIYHVELFNSRVGPIIALHEMHKVRVVHLNRVIERQEADRHSADTGEICL